jgi:hypothetical protein
MSDQNTYIRELERLIATTLLPVYEKHCLDHNIDIYNSGIPVQLLAKVKQQSNLPALLKPKQTGC